MKPGRIVNLIASRARLGFLVVGAVALLAGPVEAKELLTNATHMANAPDWLTGTRVDQVVDHIQSKMEWDIHRVEVHWYFDEASFARVNTLGAGAIAFTKHPEESVHLGPRVTATNFDQVFGHEMVHVISRQKYKGAIPAWLEEGLANYLSKSAAINYPWLASQPPPVDLRKELVHPYTGGESRARYVYMASQALAEMLAAKCGGDISDILRLSVGRKLEDYLSNICGIDDINQSFRGWLGAHAGPLGGSKAPLGTGK